MTFDSLLIMKIKKLKHSRKKEQANEDLKGRVLENQEENQRQKNLNQELEKEIEKLKEDKKSQDERFEKIHSKNNLLENKIVQIQRESSKLSEKQSQVEEVKEVPTVVKKEEKKQHICLIDIQIMIVILANDRVKMSTHKRVMLTSKQFDILSNNWDNSFPKTISKVQSKYIWDGP